MKAQHIVLYIMVLLFSSCSMQMTKHLSKNNPIEYTYHFPFDSVKSVMDTLFLSNKSEFSSCNAAFIDSNNQYNVKCWNISRSKPKSELYYSWWGKLKYFYNFNIQIDSISANETFVKFTFSVPAVKTNIADVFPNTIEEYKILLQIGDLLGEKNMPPLIKATFFKHKKVPKSSNVYSVWW